MWSGVLVSCGRAFLCLTQELETGPILILSHPDCFGPSHLCTHAFLLILPAKWRNPATARCVCKCMRVCSHAFRRNTRWPLYLTGGEHTVTQDVKWETQKARTGKESQELKFWRKQKKRRGITDREEGGIVRISSALWGCSSFEVDASEHLSSLHPLPQRSACQLACQSVRQKENKRDVALIRSVLKPRLHCMSVELQATAAGVSPPCQYDVITDPSLNFFIAFLFIVAENPASFRKCW